MLKIVVIEWSVHQHFGGEQIKHTDFDLMDACKAAQYYYGIPVSDYTHKTINVVEIGTAVKTAEVLDAKEGSDV